MAWAPWFIRRRRDADRQAELDAHLDHHIDDLIARGVPPSEARRQARLLLGNARRVREEVDDVQKLPWLDTITRDVRYALRVLRRAPGFTLTAVATLALVIGANTAVFSLANGLLFTPLPLDEPERLYLLNADMTTPRGRFSGTGQDGYTWRALSQTPLGSSSAVYSDMVSGVNLALDGQALYVEQQRVSAGFFRVLGAAPELGREFLPEEDVPGGPAVVILSHDTWRRVFGGDAHVIGRTVQLRGESWQVVGVMPAGFRGTTDADVWTPLRPSTSGEGGGTNYQIVIRLPHGAVPDAITAQLRPALDPSLRERGLSDEVTATVTLVRFDETLRADMREVIVMLGAAAALVLVIACVNLAAMLLARGATRTREVATRMALGSGRWPVVRQLLIESLVLALIGGAAGLVVGWFGLQGLQALAGERFSDWQRVTMDGRVVLATAGLSMVTSLLFGLVPALQASRLDMQAAMGEGGTRAVAGGSRQWMRRALVVAEVALGVVLLVAAGLLVRTFANLRAIDPGFSPEGLVTAAVPLLDARYTTPESVNTLFDRTLEAVRATPGIEAASISLGLPFQRALNMGFRYPGDQSAWTTSVTYATPDYFDTFQIALRRGRVLAAQDRADARPVVVVNEAFERFYSKDRDVLGRVMRVGGVEREVVGVVADVQQRPGFIINGMTPGPIVSSPSVYVPAAQINAGIVSTHVWFPPVVSVRAVNPAVAEQAIRGALGRVDAQLAVGAIRRMSEVRAEATRLEEMLTTLVGLLAVAALLLTAIGLHGVISQAVIERTREFGIRLALGATPSGTVGRVALGGLALTITGIAIGMALAQPATSLVASVLYGVAERDVPTYLGAAGFLLVVATVATVLPALRILRLDPAQTLRS